MAGTWNGWDSQPKRRWNIKVEGSNSFLLANNQKPLFLVKVSVTSISLTLFFFIYWRFAGKLNYPEVIRKIKLDCVLSPDWQECRVFLDTKFFLFSHSFSFSLSFSFCENKQKKRSNEKMKKHNPLYWKLLLSKLQSFLDVSLHRNLILTAEG